MTTRTGPTDPGPHAEYPHLFTPLTIRGRTIPNRIASSPHATGWELPGGLISDKEVDYHVRKAAGGVGLVMTTWATGGRPGRS